MKNSNSTKKSTKNCGGSKNSKNMKNSTTKNINDSDCKSSVEELQY